MRLEQLRYLMETAKAASINKAAEQLHISQQSLNMSLSKLEMELGVKLLVRSTAGVELTEAGEKAVVYAQMLLEKAEEMQQVLLEEDTEDSHQLKGHLALSAGPLFGRGILPKALGALRKDHKEIRLSLVEKENLDMIKDLLNNQPRVFLMGVLKDSEREFAMLDVQKLFHRTLGNAKLMAIVSVNHPVARQKSITVKSLLKYPLVIFQASDKVVNPILDHFATMGKPEVVVQSNNLPVNRSWLDEGEAISFAPAFENRQMSALREGTVLLPIRDLPPIELVCLADKTYYQKNHMVIDVFLSYLQEAIGGNMGEE